MFIYTFENIIYKNNNFIQRKGKKREGKKHQNQDICGLTGVFVYLYNHNWVVYGINFIIVHRYRYIIFLL